MSYVGLDGGHESFADTMRNWFFQNWPHNPKPKFVSAGGIDDTQTILRENDWRVIQKDKAAYVEFTAGDSEVIESNNALSYGKTTITVDVFGEEQAEILAGQLDSVLVNNYNAQIMKTDGRHSAILKTVDYALDWTVIQKQPDAGIVLQYSADLDIFWQKNNTSD